MQAMYLQLNRNIWDLFSGFSAFGGQQEQCPTYENLLQLLPLPKILFWWTSSLQQSLDLQKYYRFHQRYKYI